MPPAKSKIQIVVRYGGTDYIVNDKGIDATRRFELVNTKTGVTVKRSNNPYDFDDFMKQIWKEMELI